MSSGQEHERFMAAALDEAGKANRSGEFPVGCVLVRRAQIVARGFRKNSTTNHNEIDHAEIAALRDLIRRRGESDLSEVILYSTMEPCLMCFSTLILSGVRTIVYGYEDAMGGGTRLKLNELPPLYADMKVTVIPHVLRERCLELFKVFFNDHENLYWKDSYLAQYTLQQ